MIQEHVNPTIQIDPTQKYGFLPIDKLGLRLSKNRIEVNLRSKMHQSIGKDELNPKSLIRICFIQLFNWMQ
jgi:hypothetical protein